jgi:hypothetical protein
MNMPPPENPHHRDAVDSLVRKSVNRAVIGRIRKIIDEEEEQQRRIRGIVYRILLMLLLLACLIAFLGLPGVSYRIQKMLAVETPGILSHVKT